MSYADAAAKGPKQSPEEVSVSARFISSLDVLTQNRSRAPPVPSLNHSDLETSSLIDVDSPHISSVQSDFEHQTIKTDTQASRLEREYEDKVRTETRKLEHEAHVAKSKAEEKAKHAKVKAQKSGQKLKENSDNPVYIANALIWSIGAVALGVGAYQKHSEGKLDIKLAGSVAGAVGAFAVADYFASSWLLSNKYPTK